MTTNNKNQKPLDSIGIFNCDSGKLERPMKDDIINNFNSEQQQRIGASLRPENAILRFLV